MNKESFWITVAEFKLLNSSPDTYEVGSGLEKPGYLLAKSLEALTVMAFGLFGSILAFVGSLLRWLGCFGV